MGRNNDSSVDIDPPQIKQPDTKVEPISLFNQLQMAELKGKGARRNAYLKTIAAEVQKAHEEILDFSRVRTLAAEVQKAHEEIFELSKRLDNFGNLPTLTRNCLGATLALYHHMKVDADKCVDEWTKYREGSSEVVPLVAPTPESKDGAPDTLCTSPLAFDAEDPEDEFVQVSAYCINCQFDFEVTVNKLDYTPNPKRFLKGIVCYRCKHFGLELVPVKPEVLY